MRLRALALLVVTVRAVRRLILHSHREWSEGGATLVRKTGDSSRLIIDLGSESGPEAAVLAEVIAPEWASTTHEVLVMLGRKWVVAIVQQLVDGPRRSFQLRAAIGIQPKVLRETLRFLERDGIVERVLYDDEAGASVGYQLTTVGWSLLEPLSGLFAWGRGHLTSFQTAAPTRSAATG